MLHTLHLFSLLDQKLIALLRALSPDDWNKPTIAKKWRVKDIAAHLLDGNFRVISMMRDQYFVPPDREIHSYTELVGFLNDLNADFVTAARRISPALLVQLLEITSREYEKQLSLLDPEADALFSVAWAGEKTSRNWFHIAREYTEKWHHQQQIREAVGIPGIMTRELFYPVMDTFMRGLPYTYRNTEADKNTVVHITIDTETGGDWFLLRTGTGWELTGKTSDIHASLTLQPDTAWKLFTKGLPKEEASIAITGDERLARVALDLVAVMA